MSNRDLFVSFLRWLFLGESVEQQQPKPVRIKVEEPTDHRSRRRH